MISDDTLDPLVKEWLDAVIVPILLAQLAQHTIESTGEPS